MTEREEILSLAIRQLSTDLAGYTFRGKDTTLGDQARRERQRAVARATRQVRGRSGCQDEQR